MISSLISSACILSKFQLGGFTSWVTELFCALHALNECTHCIALLPYCSFTLSYMSVSVAVNIVSVFFYSC